MFSKLGRTAASRLVRQCPTVRCAAGEVLFQAGEPADRFYVVIGGRMKVYKLSLKGGEQVLHIYGPGMTIAEAAVLSGGRFPAYAEALADASLLCITRERLRTAVSSDPELVFGMLAGMAAKLREFAGMIEELSLMEVPARLAAALLRESAQAGSTSFKLGRSKRELAAQIGTVPETLSRALLKMRSSGVLRVDGSHISILKKDALEKLAAA